MTERRRRAIRLPHYDYASSGAYFVTVCSQGRRRVFGAAGMRSLVEEAWDQIPDHFPNTRTDEFVVMPNHVHGIVWIVEGDGVSAKQMLRRRRGVGAQHAAPLPEHGVRPFVLPGSLGAIIRSFKAAVSRRINLAKDTPGQGVWQRGYYERVVRNEDELRSVREYIRLNPLKWRFDRENPLRVADPHYEREWAWIEAPRGRAGP
ncbi:MAG: transposase [Dehalococcoidia bacterium]|nr:transposase [Dehalococcoidia bacterium]